MKKEDLIQYAATEDWLREQCYKLYEIAVEEHPDQFGNFIKDGAYFHEIEIDDKEVTFSFEEGRGDWFEKHYFRMSIETFLDENLFREQQKAAKIQYDKDVEASKIKKEKEKEAQELAKLEELQKKYGNKKH